jgi:hypothetical protein
MNLFFAGHTFVPKGAPFARQPTRATSQNIQTAIVTPGTGMMARPNLPLDFLFAQLILSKYYC